MVSSVDGKIDGEWFSSPEVREPLAESNAIRKDYACRATLYGARTMAQTYAEGWAKDLPAMDNHYSREDYIASSDVDSYFVVIDPKGEIAYDGKYIEKRGRAKVHVIEVLLESISDDYIAYLRGKDICNDFVHSLIEMQVWWVQCGVCAYPNKSRQTRSETEGHDR